VLDSLQRGGEIIDDRTLIEKAYDYGLTTYFLWNGLSPREEAELNKSLQDFKRLTGIDLREPQVVLKGKKRVPTLNAKTITSALAKSGISKRVMREVGEYLRNPAMVRMISPEANSIGTALRIALEAHGKVDKIPEIGKALKLYAEKIGTRGLQPNAMKETKKAKAKKEQATISFDDPQVQKTLDKQYEHIFDRIAQRVEKSLIGRSVVNARNWLNARLENVFGNRDVMRGAFLGFKTHLGLIKGGYYTAWRLHRQLDAAAKEVFNNPRRVKAAEEFIGQKFPRNKKGKIDFKQASYMLLRELPRIRERSIVKDKETGEIIGEQLRKKDLQFLERTGLLPVYNEMRKILDLTAAKAVDAGALGNFIIAYIPHIVTNPNAMEVRRIMENEIQQAYRDGMLDLNDYQVALMAIRKEDVASGLAEALNILNQAAKAPSKRSLSNWTMYAMKRRFESIAQLEREGYKVVDDPRMFMPAYLFSMHTAIANSTLREVLGSLFYKGRPVILSEAEFAEVPLAERKHYVREELPQLGKYMAFIPTESDPLEAVYEGYLHLLKPRTVWVYKPLAGYIKSVFYPLGRDTHGIKRAWWRTKGLIKRIIFYSPMIHGINIFSDVLDEMNFNVIKVIKMYRQAREWYHNRPELVEEMLENGLMLPDPQAWLNQWWTDYYRNAIDMGLLKPEEAPDFAKRHPVIDALIKMRHKWDTVLWNNIVLYGAMSSYAAKKAELLEKYPHLSDKKAGELAAHYVNDLLGILPNYWFPQHIGLMSNFMFLARNWTFSNIDLVMKGLFKRGLGSVALTSEEMQMLQDSYVRHLLKGFGALIIATNILNKMLSGHWAWENEEGHKWDIDTGIIDRKGRKVYLVFPFFRYIRDYVFWSTHPATTALHKTDVLLRGVLEQVTTYSLWRHEELYPAGTPLGEKLKIRAEYAARTMLPIGQFTGYTPVKPLWWERFIPVFGFWTRHGLAGGYYGTKIFEFTAQKRYEDWKLDKEIDELIYNGKPEEALQLILKSGRYETWEGIRARFMRAYFPLYYRWQMLSKKERMEFLQSLTPQERQQFLQLLKLDKQHLQEYGRFNTQLLGRM